MRAVPAALLAVLILAGCGEDEPTPEQTQRIEAGCVKHTVKHAEGLEGKVGGFNKWHRLAEFQRECRDLAEEAVTDPNRD